MSFADVLYTVILYPLVQVIEIAFMLFNKLFGDAGIAVMGVSFVVTVLCLPLYIVAERWQQLERDTQVRLKPGVDRIKAVFRGDEQYMILSTYYRQNHYHPMMALRSSFGLLIQVPFFMAAYSCLSSLPALQGQSFLFIQDMGAPDALFRVGGFAVNVLPMAMTAINIAAGAVYTKGFALRDKIQVYGMALLFLVLLYNSPAGPVLYWTMNNVFSLVKNIFYKLRHPVQVLYILMCAGIVFAGVYVLFIYDGGASMAKRLALVVPMGCLMLAPLVVKAVDWVLENRIECFVNTPPPIKLRIFVPVALAWTLLSGLVLPSSLIASSVQEFSNIVGSGNPCIFLLDSFWQAVGLFLFWPLCIFFLFRKKVQALMVVAFSVGLMWALLNAFVFTGNYGAMDTTLRFPDGLMNPRLGFLMLNLLALLCAGVFTVLLLSLGRQKVFSSVCLVAMISSVLFGLVNVGVLNKEYKAFQERLTDTGEQVSGDIEPVYHLSRTGKNVVVLMLDRAESSYFESILKDQPKIRDAFSGFVYYKNTVAYDSHTLLGTPPLYGGYEYVPLAINDRSEVRLKDKHNEALLLMPRILTEKAGFSATLSDTSWANYSVIPDMRFVSPYENINGIRVQGRYAAKFKVEYGVDDPSSDLNSVIKRNLIFFSLFRMSPAILRPVIYYKGTYLKGEGTFNMDELFNGYAHLHYLPELTSATAQTDSFLMITNETTHTGEIVSFYDLLGLEPMSYKNSKGYDVNTIALCALAEWLDYLKQNEVYDNTRLVVVSDHGMGRSAEALAPFQEAFLSHNKNKAMYNSLLLYKDFYSTGEIQTDMTFMTTADVPTLVLDGIVETPINPFTSNLVETGSKEGGVFVSTDDLFMPHHSKSEYIFTVPDDSWYRVRDNIFIDSNWTQEVPQ